MFKISVILITAFHYAGVIYKYFLNHWQWEINNSDPELSVEKGTRL